MPWDHLGRYAAAMEGELAQVEGEPLGMRVRLALVELEYALWKAAGREEIAAEGFSDTRTVKARTGGVGSSPHVTTYEITVTVRKL